MNALTKHLFAMLVAALLFAACGDDGGGDSTPTQCDPACTQGFVCQDGQCVEETSNECDPACTEGFVCEDGQCIEETPAECDPACTQGFVCEDGQCVEEPPVACDPPCAGGFMCQDGQCVEVIPECEPACEEGFVCQNGQCVEVPPVDCDPACEEGFVCEDGQCVEVPTPDCSPEGNVANLKACAEGPIDVTLKSVMVTYVFDQGYFVQDASGATEVYVGDEWPYDMVEVGQVIDLHATEYGSFHNQQEITASDAPVLVETGDPATYALDISDGTLPSEDIESQLVVATGITVETVDDQNLTVAYGDATGVVFRANEAAAALCPGAVFDLAAAVVTQFDDMHRLQAFHADDVTNVDTTECQGPPDADDSNWGFEEGGPQDPPNDFAKEGTDFTATWTDTQSHTDANSCLLTWTSPENQDFYQAWYMPAAQGDTVTFSLWTIDTDPAGRFRLSVEFYNDLLMSVSKEYDTIYSSDSPDWTQMTYTVDAPPETAYVRAFIRLYDVAESWDGDAEVLIDDWNVTLQ